MRQRDVIDFSFMSLRSFQSLRVICTQLPCPKELFPIVHSVDVGWQWLPLASLAKGRKSKMPHRTHEYMDTQGRTSKAVPQSTQTTQTNKLPNHKYPPNHRFNQIQQPRSKLATPDKQADQTPSKTTHEQTHPISKMRMAKDSIQIDRIRSLYLRMRPF